VSRALACAEEILAVPPDADGEFGAASVARLQSCTEELVTLGQQALPGLDRLLHGMLDRSLETSSRGDAHILEVIATKITYPDLAWKPDHFAFPWEPTLDNRKPVRRPWLRPFLLKVLKHGFVSKTEEQWFVWALWFHVPNPTDDLVTLAEWARCPRTRASGLLYLSKVSPLPRDEFTRAAASLMTSDRDSAPRTMAIALAAKFRLKDALHGLVDVADSVDQADVMIMEDYVDRRFQGSPSQEGARTFVPTIGQLAVYAIQEITGKSFGFTNCYDCKDKMQEIVAGIRRELEPSGIIRRGL